MPENALNCLICNMAWILCFISRSIKQYTDISLKLIHLPKEFHNASFGIMLALLIFILGLKWACSECTVRHVGWINTFYYFPFCQRPISFMLSAPLAAEKNDAPMPERISAEQCPKPVKTFNHLFLKSQLCDWIWILSFSNNMPNNLQNNLNMQSGVCMLAEARAYLIRTVWHLKCVLLSILICPKDKSQLVILI